MWPRYVPVDMGVYKSSRYRLLLYRDDGVTAHNEGVTIWPSQNEGKCTCKLSTGRSLRRRRALGRHHFGS